MINSILITGKETVHNLFYTLHFHVVLGMGAVFALFSGWLKYHTLNLANLASNIKNFNFYNPFIVLEIIFIALTNYTIRYPTKEYIMSLSLNYILCLVLLIVINVTITLVIYKLFNNLYYKFCFVIYYICIINPALSINYSFFMMQTISTRKV